MLVAKAPKNILPHYTTQKHLSIFTCSHIAVLKSPSPSIHFPIVSLHPSVRPSRYPGLLLTESGGALCRDYTHSPREPAAIKSKSGKYLCSQKMIFKLPSFSFLPAGFCWLDLLYIRWALSKSPLLSSTLSSSSSSPPPPSPSSSSTFWLNFHSRHEPQLVSGRPFYFELLNRARLNS